MILVVLSVLAVYVHTCALSFAQAPQAAGPEQAEDDYDYCIKQALAADKPLEVSATLASVVQATGQRHVINASFQST